MIVTLLSSCASLKNYDFFLNTSRAREREGGRGEEKVLAEISSHRDVD
jgi:hypothetical protein